MEFLQSLLLEKKTASCWEKIPFRPHHGICVPVFSLKSSLSEGIGDFYDLFLLIQWVKKIGMDLIQILPINDTGLAKSPYSAQSAFALDPVYIRIACLPNMESNPFWKKKGELLRKELQTKNVSFSTVRRKKLSFLYEYFLCFFPTLSQKKSYQDFVQKHSWLSEYALYKALRHKFREKPWYEWPKKYKNPQEKDLFLWSKQEEEQVLFYTFLQYLCFSQFFKVKKLAAEKKILLMGDIPILVSYDSVDVWFYRKTFRLDLLAGAPPDMYSREGQNWGFPTFNWDFLEKNNYSWWRKRIEIASLFYDLYRIDHLVGFFRIWSIKPFELAKQGRFVSENRLLWPFLGEKRLESLITMSSMLPIAEDLGTIPHEVRPILKKLGICKTLVARWEKTEEGELIHPKDYPYLSFCCLSTHDSEPFEIWWENNPLEAKNFAKLHNLSYRKKLSLSSRKCFFKKIHSSPSLFHVNLLPEYLALAYKGEGKSRINTPGTISFKNWSYRMEPCLEKLLSHTSLIQAIRSITKKEK